MNKIFDFVPSWIGSKLGKNILTKCNLGSIKRYYFTLKKLHKLWVKDLEHFSGYFDQADDEVKIKFVIEKTIEVQTDKKLSWAGKKALQNCYEKIFKCKGSLFGWKSEVVNTCCNKCCFDFLQKSYGTPVKFSDESFEHWTWKYSVGLSGVGLTPLVTFTSMEDFHDEMKCIITKANEYAEFYLYDAMRNEMIETVNNQKKKIYEVQLDKMQDFFDKEEPFKNNKLIISIDNDNIWRILSCSNVNEKHVLRYRHMDDNNRMYKEKRILATSLDNVEISVAKPNLSIEICSDFERDDQKVLAFRVQGVEPKVHFKLPSNVWAIHIQP
ncbi:MAG: hypothetical protein MJ218_02855 [Opitutales bacterium]|nr:hypothetical protein [Opitutales bacterium]